MSDDPLVSARGLSKRYAGVHALADVDFRLAAGEVVGVVGKNGAGKSTLIRIIAGAERPDEGELRIAGQTVTRSYDPAAASALGLAFVHQELSNAPDMSVAENVALGGQVPQRAGVIAWKQLRRQVAGILADLDPDIDPRATVGDLSPARQRLVMIARALYGNAKALVLDEPSASLTADEVAQLHTLIRRLAAGGCAIVYVSHRLKEIVSLTERVVVMHDGSVTLDRATAGLDEAQLIEAILGDDANADTASIRRATGSSAGGDAAGEVLLRVTSLTRAPRVRDVSFDLHAGEVLGLGGLVGAGRTEIARLIAGLDRPDSGTIELGGRRRRFRSPADALAAGIALVPEDRRAGGVVLDFNVQRNLTLASLSRLLRKSTPFPSPQAEARVTGDMIDRLGIVTAGPSQTVGTLSGGNQQKVVIGKYLLRDPKVLVVDEPALGIDVHAKQEIFLLLQRLARAGAGVIVISSDFAEIVDWCDRVLGIHEGTISGELAGARVTERAITELAYGRTVAATPESVR